MAGDIAGHQIRRELDAGEGAADGPGQGQDQEGLAEAWHALDEHVTTGQEGQQDLVHDAILTHQGLAHLVAHASGGQGGGLELGGCQCRRRVLLVGHGYSL